MRGLVSPARLYATQRPKQLLRGDRDHRAIANVRVQETLESRAENRDGLYRERLALELEPFLRDCFECLGSSAPLRFAPDAGIDPVCDELSRFVALLARA